MGGLSYRLREVSPLHSPVEMVDHVLPHGPQLPVARVDAVQELHAVAVASYSERKSYSQS